MTRFHDTVFIGSGISCLAAARRCGGDHVVFESDQRPGGLCRTERVGDFAFDYTGHLLHLRPGPIARWLKSLLRGKLVGHERSAWVFSNGVYTRYPYQQHFYGLPVEVAADCLLGMFEASKRRQRKATNFAEWVLSTFGEGVARHFMFPYNRKLWTVEPSELTTEWMGRFVPRPDLRQVILGALADVRDRAGYNPTFLYPREGGIETLVKALARRVRIECGRRVVEIDAGARRLRLWDGEWVGFGRLVSCAPLPELVRMTKDAPDGVRRAAGRLRWVSVYNLNVGLKGEAPPRHWVYVPEKRFRIYRFGYQSNFCRAMAPPGHYSIYTELAVRGGKPARRSVLRERVLADLRQTGVLGPRERPAELCELVLPYAYVIYDRNRTPAVNAIRRWFEQREIWPVGRFGRWEYGSMEDAVRQGLEVADLIARGRR
ncbi:MAG: protoporphyrinogen oxidase [Deltaproteobacteria bacterium]|nr:MAG: protoporphyrinogen oxidase [Deltaproteobacteria bacterium]